MWGEGEAKVMQACPELAEWEQSILKPFSVLQNGLENARLDYQRRALRCVPRSMSWSLLVEGDTEPKTNLSLSFELAKGQFATSVIRELVMV